MQGTLPITQKVILSFKTFDDMALHIVCMGDVLPALSRCSPDGIERNFQDL